MKVTRKAIMQVVEAVLEGGFTKATRILDAKTKVTTGGQEERQGSLRAHHWPAELRGTRLHQVQGPSQRLIDERITMKYDVFKLPKTAWTPAQLVEWKAVNYNSVAFRNLQNSKPVA